MKLSKKLLKALKTLGEDEILLIDEVHINKIKKLEDRVSELETTLSGDVFKGLSSKLVKDSHASGKYSGISKTNPNKESYDNDTIEKLADLCHRQWVGWVKYLVDKCQLVEDRVAIPTESVERLSRQVNTDYNDLPEDEKESDRVEARKILDLLGNKPNNKISEMTECLKEAYDSLSLWAKEGYDDEGFYVTHYRDGYSVNKLLKKIEGLVVKCE